MLKLHRSAYWRLSLRWAEYMPRQWIAQLICGDFWNWQAEAVELEDQIQSAAAQDLRLDDCLVAFGSGRDKRERRAGQLGQPCDILARLFRQIFKLRHADGLLSPPRHRFVDRLGLRHLVGVVWDLISLPAVDSITDADFDFVQVVKHVELGQRQRVQSVDHHGVARDHGVEPTGAPRAPR